MSNGFFSIFRGATWITVYFLFWIPTGRGADCVAVPYDHALFIQWRPVSGATDYLVQHRAQGGSIWTDVVHAPSTACGRLIVGLTNGEAYDVQVSAMIPAGDATLFASSGTPGATLKNAFFHQILQTGQSLADGALGSPALTLIQPYNNKMLDATMSSLVPLVEPHTRSWLGIAETNATSMANFLSAASTDYDLVVNLHGLGSTWYGGLKKGTYSYDLGMSQMQATHRLGLDQGRASRVAAVTVIHGEADDEGGTTATQYAGFLGEWQHDYEEDVKAFTGQDGPLPLFTTQLATWTGWGMAAPKVAIGQLSAARTYPSIYLVTPTYMLQYADPYHLTAPSYRRVGEYFGKAMKRVLIDGEHFRPVSPFAVARQGTIIEAQFYVPVAPLAFDTSSVVAKPNFGFEYFDSQGSTTIASVSLRSPDTVRITLSQEPTGSSQRLRYAYSGRAAAGSRTADTPSGNLRDSDPTPSLYNDANNPTWMGAVLRNWCVVFDDPIETATPLNVWRLKHFDTLMGTAEAGNEADPDHDGMKNIEEFILNSNPLISDGQLAPDALVEGGNFQLSYRLRTNISGLIVQPQWSTDLQHWFPMTNGSPTTLDAITQLQRATIPLSGSTKLFGRLKIELP